MSSYLDRCYQDLKVYFGDIHNHCDLSYGRGSLQAALDNAQLQLDFTSVTVHAVWPDLPTDDPNLAYLVDYHEKGFAKAQANWAGYLAAIERANKDGQFVTFPSFEWHSMAYGDYCIYYQQALADLPIVDAPDLPGLREILHKIDTPTFLIPHHIGYKQGFRGINWEAFSDDLSPVAEIFSFHGLSESSEGPYPYLHSMGPRHEHSTAQYGWAQGNLFGVIGSTDHHNAFPGSYGYGRLGVWAEALTREAIWDAIRQRRTYALTGDNILVRFGLNGHPMGSLCSADEMRNLHVAVEASDAIDTIEVLHNNRVVHRESVLPHPAKKGRFKIYVEMGWGELSEPFAWDVSATIMNGALLGVEPHIRGIGPHDDRLHEDYTYTTLDTQDNRVQIQTKTQPNPSLHTAATEGFCLEVDGDAETVLQIVINGQENRMALGDILTGSQTFYTSGFVSPSLCVHQAVPEQDYTHEFTFTHHHQSRQRDWYYVRVRQRNNQWAWTSPIWVEGSS